MKREAEPGTPLTTPTRGKKDTARTVLIMGSIHFFAGVAFLIFGFIYWFFVKSGYMMISNCFFSGLCFLSWVVHHKWGKPEVFATVLVIVVYTGLANVVVHLGHHHSPLMFWGLAILIGAAYINGPRGTAFWTVMTLAFLPLCLYLKRVVFPERSIPLDVFQTDLLYYATYVGVGFFLGYACVLAQRKIDRTLRELESNKAALERSQESLEERVQQRTAALADAVSQLGESEALLEAIVDNMPYVLSIKDCEDLRYVRINRAGEELLGYSKGELLGKRDGDVFPASTADAATEDDRAVLRSGKMLSVQQTSLETRDKGSRTLRTTKVPIAVETGRIQYLLSISEDITKQLRMQEERQALEISVQQAHRLESLGVLAGGIAHDFNNLLAAIYGNVDLALQDLDSNSAPAGHLAEARRAGERAAELVNQLLAYAGRGKASFGLVNMNQLVQGMIELLKASISKKTSIVLDLDQAHPTIRGDATQLRQIVLNLITNAAQAIGQEVGEIRVTTEVLDCDQSSLKLLRLDEELSEGRYVAVRISDSGAGMSPDLQGRIFEPFFTTKDAGSGLGLSAVHGIVRSHNGGISLKSEEGRGTTFTLLLPVSDKVRVSRSTSPATSAWHGTGTVLVIDDEDFVRSVTAKVIAKLGFTPLTAADGAEGVALFLEHREEIVCVLLDSKMPNMDGKETFQELCRLGVTAPVILCSGYTEEDSTQELYDDGLAGFLHKPYSVEELKNAVREVLDG